MLVEAGCVTSANKLSNYKKEGVQYGTTKGTFRGRWWNCYERGRSYQDGAFYKEAENDFRTALASYAQDELWARTYGLHFIPEFFPHRELGVTLYYEKRFPESIAELELSLQQQHSARAAYFLDEARKELIQSAGQDAPAPAITIRTPTPGSRFASLHADVTGEVNGANHIAALRINGRKYPLAVSNEHVEFTYQLQLRPGSNEIVIEADDLAAKHSKETLQINVDVDGPVVSFDPAGPVPGQVRGVAFDASGVESLRMGDRQADVQRAQDGRVTFSFVAPESPADRALTYECRDTLGNATRGSVP
jgi:tetratricopeptide (TPR) repeat protein